jgi:hypothetical protein
MEVRMKVNGTKATATEMESYVSPMAHSTMGFGVKVDTMEKAFT